MISGGQRPAITIAPAAAGDAVAIAALLREAGLPHEDCAAHLAHFLVSRGDRGVIVGVVGAEVHAPEALLRSLVVAPAYRGTGLGGELVQKLEMAAAGWGVERWWLLTTSAEKFFAGRGFVVVPRTVAPPAIQRTSQFSGRCCGSAVCMTRPHKDHE